MQHIGEIEDMGRNVHEVEKQIFSDLSNRITENNREFTANPSKFIHVSKNEYNVIEHAKIKTISLGKESLMAVIDYQDRRYIGIPESEYSEGFFSNDEELFDDETMIPEIINGMGILLFLYKIIDLNSSMTEMKIYNEILGIEKDQSLNCSEFLLRIEDYRICTVDKEYYEIKFVEDAKRLLCALVCDRNKHDNLYNYIYELMMLESSRSVVDIVYSVTEINNEELIYLQIYRALEYLFTIIRAKNISDDYDVPVDKTIDILVNEKIWNSEQSSVQMLVEKSSTISKNDYCNYLSTIGIDTSDETKKVDAISRYIYEQRCKIAHYKYRHEPLKDLSTLHQSSICLLKLIISLFREFGEVIVALNEQNNVWEELVLHASI